MLVQQQQHKQYQRYS